MDSNNAGLGGTTENYMQLGDMVIFVCHISPVQGLANYLLWAKSGSPPAFINKVLLKHSHNYLNMYFLWMLLHYSGKVEKLTDFIAHKAINIYLACYCSSKVHNLFCAMNSFQSHKT